MFDLNFIHKNKERALLNIRSLEFYQFIYSDLIRRLEPVDRSYQIVLALGFGDSCGTCNNGDNAFYADNLNLEKL